MVINEDFLPGGRNKTYWISGNEVGNKNLDTDFNEKTATYYLNGKPRNNIYGPDYNGPFNGGWLMVLEQQII